MLVSALENLLNRGLPRSVRARALCAELEGRRLAVEMPGLGRALIGSSGTALTVRRGEEAAEASLSGGPLSLGVLGIGLSHEPIRRGDVQVHGDAELAEKFQQLLRLLRPDPEEELAVLVGDVPAHRIGQLARGALGWSGRAVATLWRDLGDYAAHERRDLVSAAEGETFLHGVDALREDADRLAAQVEQLERRVAAP
jgi:ubiquinone biosynthesis protein UbiJ